MRKYILRALLFIMLLGATDTFAQDYHCYKAWKKSEKSNKKEWKIRGKMFRDRQWKASKKRRKSVRKLYKSDMKEYQHRHFHDYWY